MSITLAARPVRPSDRTRVCEECDRRAEMFDLLSASDYIFFMGHGSPQSFSTNEHIAKFNLENVADVDF